MSAARVLISLILSLGVTTAAVARTNTSVAFTTADGVMLRGWLWKRAPTAVIFSHMFGTDQSIWAEFAEELSSQGYTVLTYDFRGVGRSGGRFVIAQVDRDVLAAVRFVRGLGERRVFLIGASLGGTASLVAAGQTQVDGVVVMASGTQWQGLDARPYLPVLKVPKLFIVGSGDAPFNYSAQVMYAQTPEPKQLVVIPTDQHGTYMLQTEHRNTIEHAIAAFLKKHAAP